LYFYLYPFTGVHVNTFRINSNPASALAYRNLPKSQFNLQTTLERLSSGLRINKAADDSAGSAISTRMNNQIRGMKQANENAQQANNLIQTAESGLHDISDMLSRMRELAVQASTDTLNNTDRASIDLEYQALKNEVTRIANVTQYNEMDILNGTDYRNQVNANNSTADDVSGVSIQTLDKVIKGTYTLQDQSITNSTIQLSNLSINTTGGDTNLSISTSANGLIAGGDYRVIRSKISSDIILQISPDSGTTWNSVNTIPSHTLPTNGSSNTATFQTTDGGQIQLALSSPAIFTNTGSPTQDADGDGVPDAKDDYPTDASKVKDLDPALALTDSPGAEAIVVLDSSNSDMVEKDGSNKVSKWFDISGKTNHFSQSNTSRQPVYNLGTNSIQFNGSASGYSPKNALITNVENTSIADIGVDPFSLFIVAKPEGSYYQSVFSAWDQNSSTVGPHGFQIKMDLYGGNRAFYLTNYGSVAKDSLNLTDDGGGSRWAIEYGETQIYTITKSQDTNFDAFTDGTKESSGEMDEIDFSQLEQLRLGDISGHGESNLAYPGGSNNFNGNNWGGEIFEVILIKGELSDVDRTKVNAYLADKWDLTTTVDSDGDGVVDANDVDQDIQILSEFSVPIRTLSLTDADDNSQDLDYVAGSSETLNFSDFGIQVDLDSTYSPSSGLNGTDIEITASRDLQVGADNDANHHLQLGISSATASGLRIDGSRVVDIDQARAAITSLDNATDMVNQERSLLGSMQNRLAFTMSNLTSQTQNIEASRSTIEDANFAAEAADMAKNQILAQSATAMLAQASAISQNILGLLR